MLKLRNNTKQAVVIEELRRRIVTREYAPGARLPSYGQLEQHYAVSHMTMQKTLRRLMEEGFIVGEERKGLFVVPTPPHLFRVGLIFQYDENENMMWLKLAQAARRIEEKSDYTIEIYRGIEEPCRTLEARKLLENDLTSHRLAGLISPYFPEDLLEWLETYHPELPLVSYSSANINRPHVHIIEPSSSIIRRKMLEWLASQGRQRIAIIGVHGHFNHEEFTSEVTAMGLSTRLEWQLSASLRHPDSVVPIVRLLMSLEESRRPDGLMIINDNFLDRCICNILDCGIRIPEQLSVASLCNWPAETEFYPVPIFRVGNDVNRMMARALELIDGGRSELHGERRVEPIPLYWQ